MTNKPNAPGNPELRPEIEYEQLESGSCLIGDALCYHPQDPMAFAVHQAHEIATYMNRERVPILHFLGMGRGFIQAELAKILPPMFRLVLWDEHPNLSKMIVPPDLYDGIHKRWTVVHQAQRFVEEVEKETVAVKTANNGVAAPVRRTLAVHPGMNEVLHWPLGFIDWMKRNRRHLRSMNPLAMIPSPRSIRRISEFGFIPGVHQLNHIGDHDAIIVSCGPSLNDDSLKAIKLAVQRGAVVFCVGQALKRLNDADIQPHYVVVADPSEVMYQMVAAGDFGLALCDGMVSELFTMKLVDHQPNCLDGRVVFFNILSSHVHQAVCDMLDWPIYDDSFATVSEISVCLSRVLGAKRIFLVGVDFGAGVETKVNPFPQYMASFRMPTYDGSLVWTNAHYNHARRWMESHVAVPEMQGSIYRYAVGLPVAGEVRVNPDSMLKEIRHSTRVPMPKAPAARGADVLTNLLVLSYLKRKGYDANDAVSNEHPDDFRYALMGSSHERKLTLIELAMGRVCGDDAQDKSSVPTGAVVPTE